jgi:hypothetical protein
MNKIRKIAASETLAPHDVRGGLTLITTAADVIVTLPKASRQTRGARVTLVQRSLSGGTGAQLSPHSGDYIRGQTLAGVAMTAVVDKNLINTGGTDVLGDSVTIECDGEAGWDVVSILGIWAKEP